MASIRKRGSSYLIVVSMGYDYNGKRKLIVGNHLYVTA